MAALTGPVARWTNADACRLQSALRLTNERYAEHLGIAVRTVGNWHAKPLSRPREDMQQVLDTAYERATPAEQGRFLALGAGPDVGQPAVAVEEDLSAARERLAQDANIEAALEWLDRAADWAPGEAREFVASALNRVRLGDLRERANRRARVRQRDVAAALASYYRERPEDFGCYAARFGGGDVVPSSVLTRRSWLDLQCEFGGPGDTFALDRRAPAPAQPLDSMGAERAGERLAETLVTGGRLVDRPLYRLLAADVARGRVAGTVGLTTFAAYALTLDLVEGELVDALAGRTAATSLALRERLLPDVDAVLDLPSRLCCGGMLSLCALARPDGDYVLLVQERSSRVLNAPRSLAVIPKAFHQPLSDPRGNAPIGQTLLREMEEELFGREGVDSTVGDPRALDPMHPTLLSEPMRWLTEHPDAWTAECTGFGINLMSGNFEVAGLVVVHDADFWSRYGGKVEANWETSTLRLYSTDDVDGVAELVDHPGWSNEGIFAFVQGLRRLRELAGDGVDLPPIEWEIA